jgi:hypothetical protein
MWWAEYVARLRIRFVEKYLSKTPNEEGISETGTCRRVL